MQLHHHSLPNSLQTVNQVQGCEVCANADVHVSRYEFDLGRARDPIL